MESNNHLEVYHSTAEKNIESILNSGFRLPTLDPNKIDRKNMSRFFKYWLGAGIYFFEDIEVAKWWSTHPSSTFGSRGKHKVLKASLKKCNIVDLRKVSEWRKLIQGFDAFMDEVGKQYVVNLPSGINIHRLCQKSASKKNNDTNHKLRCMFFNWYQSVNHYDAIIASFNQEEFKYLENGDYNIGEYLDIYYAEVQYCVYNPNIIENCECASE